VIFQFTMFVLLLGSGGCQSDRQCRRQEARLRFLYVCLALGVHAYMRAAADYDASQMRLNLRLRLVRLRGSAFRLHLPLEFLNVGRQDYLLEREPQLAVFVHASGRMRERGSTDEMSA